jgi:antitoxin ParD1/3/4
MTSLNVSIPTSLKYYVEAQVRAGGYSTPSEYVRTLIREDRKRKTEEALEKALLEGLSSGPPLEADRALWDAKRHRLRSRLGKGPRR